MKNRTVLIQASARSKGDTHTIVDYIHTKSNFDVIDLKTKTIGHFDYNFAHADDDFIPLLEEIIANYDTIIFATPVYWYTMSGLLKVFFDRLSDLLHYKKELGRKLRGKNMAMVSISNSNDLKAGYNMPFKESAHYLGMQYLGDVHTWVENGNIPEKVKDKLDLFLKQLN